MTASLTQFTFVNLAPTERHAQSDSPGSPSGRCHPHAIPNSEIHDLLATCAMFHVKHSVRAATRTKRQRGSSKLLRDSYHRDFGTAERPRPRDHETRSLDLLTMSARVCGSLVATALDATGPAPHTQPPHARRALRPGSKADMRERPVGPQFCVHSATRTASKGPRPRGSGPHRDFPAGLCAGRRPDATPQLVN